MQPPKVAFLKFLFSNFLIKFNNFLVKIPKQTKRVWDLAENRWGYKKNSKN